MTRAMLLRSASSPLLNCARAPAAAEHHAVVSPSVVAPPRQGAVLCRAMSEGDLAAQLAPAVRGKVKDEGAHGWAPRRLSLPASSSSSASISVKEEDGEGEEEEEAEAEAADAHYRQMIEADPGNPLLLVNYARFLREVEGDAARAQEFCERAILASPGDAEALSLYAGLVWETSRDAARAEDYYSRAVQAAPDDCYVLGSYAGFLWDAEEDDEESDNAEPFPPPPSPFLGAAQHPSITAAS